MVLPVDGSIGNGEKVPMNRTLRGGWRNNT